MEFAKPVSMSIGEQIDLTALKGKLIAVKILARETVKTKFGERVVNTASVVVEGQVEPLIGGLFSSYFKRLEESKWYIGRVVKDESGKNPRWGLTEATKKDDKKVATLQDAATAADQE